MNLHAVSEWRNPSPHRFHDQFPEFCRVSLFGTPFGIVKAPFVDSISYCLTNGVPFTAEANLLYSNMVVEECLQKERQSQQIGTAARAEMPLDHSIIHGLQQGAAMLRR